MKDVLSEKIRILLVDDNPINRKLAKIHLDKYGHEIEMAVNGLESVEKFRDNEYDLILMDINMPVMDGIQATKEIREVEKGDSKRKRTSIIAVTANAFVDNKDQCLKSGMDAYLSKPFRPEDLVQTINLLRAG